MQQQIQTIDKQFLDSQELLSQELPNGEILKYLEFNKELENTIVFIHGNMISSYWWYPMFPYLINQKDFRVILLDLRGFGSSTYNNKISKISDFCEDIYQFSQKLNLKASIYVGWSLGGMIVQNLACQFPEIVKGLVLVASGSSSGYHINQFDKELNQYTTIRCQSQEEVISDQRISYMNNLVQTKDVKALQGLFQQTLFNGNGSYPKDENLLNLLVEETVKQRCYLDVIWAMHTHNILKEAGTGLIEKLSCKVLIYHGGKDLVIPLINGKGIAQDIGEDKCEIVIKEETAHCPPFDEPQDLSQRILEFSKNQISVQL